eukprot:8714651-Prorocentrum_lima.AAC.1
MKRNKATGPDLIPVEFFKAMDEESLSTALAILNSWWQSEHIPTSALRALVVLLFKKGSREDLHNYRPISLLNTLYKLYARIIHKRLASVIEPYLQQTQYGFRAHRGAADAIHFIRRLVDKGE